MHPFRRLLKLLHPSRAALEVDEPVGSLAGLWPDASFFHPRDVGSEWAGPARAAAVVFPRWDPKAKGAEPRALDGGEAVRRLTGQLLLPPGSGPVDFDLLARAIADAPASELRYGSAADTVPVLRRLLGA